jgi:ribonuclease T2
MGVVRWMIAAFLSILLLPGAVMAQANQCNIPSNLPAAAVEAAPDGQAHVSPLTGYMLALSWSPEFCKAHPGADQAQQCGSKKFGFILHGLWPDGSSKDGLQWCKPAVSVPAEIVRQSFCAMPSVKLQAHEWAKHGTCMTDDPARYFRTGTMLFNALKWPDMNALSRAQPSVASFVSKVIGLNPGLRANMLSVQTGKGGWLKEVHLCLGTDLHTRACPRYVRGARPEQRLKIWRAEG